LIFELFKESLRSIMSNKTRTFLSMLGITIGVAAVIAVVSLGQGASESVKKRISSLGSNIIFITPGRIGGAGGRLAQAVGNVLNEEDVRKMKQFCYSLSNITPVLQKQSVILFEEKNTIATVMGVYPSIFDMMELKVEKGRPFLESDEGKRVIVLGEKIAEDLFEGEDPVGQKVYIITSTGKQSFTVIGVLKKSGQLLFFNPDNAVFLPFKTAQYRIFHTKKVSLIVAKTISQDLTDTAVSEIDDYLYKKFKDENMYNIVSQEAILSTLNETMAILNLTLGGIAGISLLVGGIGIMNIMLVSVTERTREIGIKKAIGATNSSILLQFLMESIIITLIAGIVGILLGALIANFVGRMVNISVLITPSVIMIAMGVSTGVGLFFGVYPAYKASKLDPVDALRYE